MLSNNFADKFNFQLSNFQLNFYSDSNLTAFTCKLHGVKANVIPHNNANKILPIFEAPLNVYNNVENIEFFTRPELNRRKMHNSETGDEILDFISLSFQYCQKYENRRFCYLNINNFSVAVATRLLKILKRNLFALELKRFFKTGKHSEDDQQVNLETLRKEQNQIYNLLARVVRIFLLFFLQIFMILRIDLAISKPQSSQPQYFFLKF